MLIDRVERFTQTIRSSNGLVISTNARLSTELPCRARPSGFLCSGDLLSGLRAHAAPGARGFRASLGGRALRPAALLRGLCWRVSEQPANLLQLRNLSIQCCNDVVSFHAR